MAARRISTRQDMRAVLRRSTALTTVSLLSLSLFGPALADGGAGGSGAAGGTGFTGNPGVSGMYSGGGGGAGGGAGGSALASGFPSALGGSAGSPNGGDGWDSGHGGGGGYNGNGSGSATVVNTVTLSGGTGGRGGDFTYIFGIRGEGAGGGGAGGYGAIATTAGANSNTGTISGGAGGRGGMWLSNVHNVGHGGDGGVGLQFTPAGATLTNSGTIQGGDGGESPSLIGYGAGGTGIVGAGLTIINSGTITAGMSRGVVRPQARAIDFTGGINALTFLNDTSGLTGDIDVTGSLDFNQPTDTTVSNIISGTGSVSKSGAGTLTLTGANTYSGGTSLLGGRLAVAADDNLGAPSGGLTFNGGTLATTATFNTGRVITLTSTGIFDVAAGTTLGLTGPLSGVGGLEKNGAGTLTLSGANTYLGGTTVNAGVLDLGGVLMQGMTSLSGTGGTIDSGAGLVILTIDQAAATSFDGNFVGDIAMTKTGSGSLTLNGVVDGIGTGINLSSGTLVLNGANTYGGGSGSMLFGDASLIVGNDTALSTSRVTVEGANSNLSSNRAVTLANTFDINRANGANLRVSGANNLTLTGNIEEIDSGGGGAVIKSGSGTLTLSGVNSYSGGTVLSGGRLSVSADNNLGAALGSLTFNGGTLASTATFNSARTVALNGLGTIDVAGGTTLGLNGPLSGVGGLVKNGTGTLALTGANTYSGGTTVNAGVLKKDGSGLLPARAFTVNGGVLDLGMPSFSTQDMTSLSGTGGTINFGTKLVMLTINQSTATSFDGDLVGTAGLITKSGNGSLTLNGVIGGMGTGIGLSQGTLVLNGANTYGGGSGSTLFGNANLVVGNDRALSTSRVTINNAGADLSSNRDVTLANNFVMSRTAGASLSVSGAHNLTLTGILSESDTGGGGLLMKNGTGTLTLTGNNSYSGGTVVSGGRLQISADRNLGALSGGLTFNSGTLATAASFDSARTVTLNGVGTVDVAGNATLGLTGQMTGAGSLQKSGTGLLRLSGTNNYLGGTELLGGTIEVGADANLGNAAGAFRFGGASGQLSVTQSFDTGRLFGAHTGTQAEISTGTNIALGIAGGMDFTGATLTKAGAGTLRLTAAGVKTIDDLRISGGSVHVDGGTVGFSGAPALYDIGYGQTGAGDSAGLSVSNGGSVKTGRANVGSGLGSGRLAVNGAGSLFEAGAIDLASGSGTGLVTVADGGTLKASGGTGTITLGNALSATARLTIGADVGNPSGPAAATGAGQVLADIIRFGYSGATLDLNHTSSGYQLASAIQSGANGHGLINHYAGETTLSGNGTGFSGAVNLIGGTLRVNGALGGTVDVLGGATLGGSGTVGNTAVADGGRLSPGNSVGTLTIAGNLSLASGSILDYELGSAGTAGNPALVKSDRIDVSGNLILDGTINFGQSGSPADGTSGLGYYRLMTYGGTLTDNGLLLGSTPTFADPARLQLQVGGGRVDLFVASVGDEQLQHWQGGDGTWNAANTNWLNIGTGAPAGVVPTDWKGNTAVFKNEPGGFSGGIVTVSGTQAVKGLQFVDEGYSLAGSGALAVDSSGAEIRVLANRAEIATTITGSGGLSKTQGGTLALTGANSYSGGTTILGGAIEVSADGNLGASSGGLTLHNGALSTIASFDSSRSVSLTGQGGFNVAAATTLGLTGTIDGTGTLVKSGTGTLKLTGTNSYAGGTSILGGTVEVSADANLGAESGGLALNGGTLSTLGSFDSGRSVALAGQGGFNVATATTLGLTGTVTGAGALVKSGAGTLKLSGTNSYADGTSIIGGTVEVSADGNLGATSGGLALKNAAVSATGTFNSNRSVLITGQGGFDVATATALGLTGTLTGTGTLVKTGAGTLKLTGTNGYSGGTTILGGSVDVSADGNLGAAIGGLALNSGVLSATGSFDSNRSVSLTGQGGFDVATATTLGMTGTVTGTGTLVKTGAGTLKLTGTNGYSGGTTILGGSVDVSADGNLGAANGGLALNSGVLSATGSFDSNRSVSLAGQGSFNVATATTLGLTGTVTGTGALVKTGAGTLKLTGTNTYSGGTTILGGAVDVSTDGNLGAASGGLTFNGGVLSTTATFDSGRSVSLAGQGSFDVASATTLGLTGTVTGPGTLLKTGAGTLKLTGTNAYGNTRVGAGTLIGSAASIRGNIVNDGSVIFDQATDADFAGTVTGQGTMRKQGSGRLWLKGASTAHWAVDAGGVSASADKFSGDLAIGAGGNFTFSQQRDAAFAGRLAGAGSFTKSGGGTLLYTGDASGFTGRTEVAGGQLTVGAAGGSAAMGGTMDVLSGGRLGGSGKVGTVNLGAGATIAAGNSIGTLTIAGDLAFDRAAALEVEVDPIGMASDLVKVTGIARLNGATVRHIGLSDTYNPISTYTILTADGGVAGTFGSITSGYAFLLPELVYDPNRVSLRLTRNNLAFADKAWTSNQRASAAGAESLGPAHTLYGFIAALPDDGALIRNAFDRLSGEIHASAKTALIEDSRFLREAIAGRMDAAFSDAPSAMPILAYGPGGPELGPANSEGLVAWGHAFGAWGHTDTDGNAAALDRSSGGFLMGADAAIAPHWRLGLVAGYSRSSFDIDDRGSSGNSDNYHVGLYTGGEIDALRLTGGLSYSWNDIETTRSVVFGGLDNRLDASYDGGLFQAFTEASYRIESVGHSVEPFAALAHVSLHTDGFVEQGGAAALSAASQATDTTFTTLGARAATQFDVGGMEASAHATLGWRHAFGDVTPISSQRFAGGAAFSVAGIPIAEDAAVIRAGFDFAITPDATLDLSYTGQVAKDASEHGVAAKLSLKF